MTSIQLKIELTDQEILDLCQRALAFGFKKRHKRRKGDKSLQDSKNPNDWMKYTQLEAVRFVLRQEAFAYLRVQKMQRERKGCDEEGQTV